MSPPEPLSVDDAFVRELTESQSALRGYCFASLGYGEEAKDAVQRVNLVLWKKSGQWRPGTKFLSWALAVARFEVLASVRHRQRERVLFDSDVVELMAGTAEAQAPAAAERTEALVHCLEKLRPDHRGLLLAHYVTGHTTAEIAQSRGQGRSAIKVQLLRIRRTLAECIQKNHRLPLPE
jgi:RNA polymerase sigma-70 factor (ECF subfamily)